jgi:tetratricopeptide (TPR) repeat protein
MKKQMPPARPKVAPPVPVPVHQLEHAVPTVIHNPEDDMTALGRLTFHVLQDPRKYSTWALSVLLGILAVIFLMNFSSGSNSRSSVAWSKLEAAKKVEEREGVAKEYPKSSAAPWALLQAASEHYMSAFNDLPRNPEVALGEFKKAHDLFDQVYRESPKDSFEARAALLGVARSLEARNDLAKAIEKYDLITTSWPGTPEAEQAKQLADALRNPDAASFYKQLYAYSPPKVTLPPMSTQDLQFPGPGLGLPADAKISLPAKPTPLIDMPLELPPPTAAERKKLEETKPTTTPPASKTDAAKTDAAAKTDSAKTPATKPAPHVEVIDPSTTAPKKK